MKQTVSSVALGTREYFRIRTGVCNWTNSLERFYRRVKIARYVIEINANNWLVATAIEIRALGSALIKMQKNLVPQQDLYPQLQEQRVRILTS